MASWQRSGNILFEKVDVCEVKDVVIEDEENMIVALSRFGGPTATYNSKNGAVRVFAGGGKWITSWVCPNKLCPGGFGWTEDLVLTLVCEDDEGTVYTWDDFVRPQSGPGKLKTTFGQPIRMATFWNTSVIGLTAKMAVLVMKDLRISPHLKWAPVSFPLVHLPRALCTLRPFAIGLQDIQLEIAVALPDQAGMLVASPERKSVDARVPQFRALPSRFLVPHPTEPIIATLDISDRLLVVNTSWEEILYARDCELGMGFQNHPVSLDWCMGGSFFF